jgi:death-on-curing protein
VFCLFKLLDREEMTIYLNKQDIIYINERVLQQQGVQSQLLNEGILESALMRPQTSFYYQNADIITQGALLIAGIALAHPFLDGNKRTALIAGYDFFKVNGYQIIGAPLEFAYQIEAIINHKQSLDEMMSIFIDWLQGHIH